MRDIAIVLDVRESNEIKVKLSRDKSDANINVEEVAYRKK